MKQILFFIILIVANAQHVLAQKVDCEQTLNAAQEEFNAGRFYGLSTLLQGCIEKGFTNEQRQRAYFLLAQTYLLIDDPIAAEDSYLKLLRANPEFVTDALRDPIDVVYLSKKFTAAPIFSLYAKVGPNLSPVHTLYNVNLNADGNSTDVYTVKPGFQLSVGSDVSVNNNIMLCGGVQYMFTAYKREVKNMFNLYANENSRDKVEIIDKQNWVNVPLSLKYNYLKSKLRPFFYLGYSFNVLLTDKAVLKYTDSDLSTVEGIKSSTYTSPNFNLKYRRKIFTQSFILGGGVKRKIGLNYIFAEVRYAFGLRNLVRPTNLYANYGDKANYSSSQQLPFNYSYVDDYFRLDNLSVSVGYIYPLYKPRKLKKSNTKSVMRKIRKQN